MPKKRNSAYKVMKKVNEAESAQQRRIKNDAELRAIVKDLAASKYYNEKIVELDKELKKRKENIDAIVESQKVYLKEIYKNSGVAKFSPVKKGDQKISATVHDLASTCRLLVELNCKIEERENVTKEKMNTALDNLLNLKQRENVQKDIIGLHRRPKRKINKTREELEKRMDILTKEIQFATEKFEKKIMLENKKETEENAKNKSLEEYINKNINDLKEEVNVYSKKLKTLNLEVNTLVAKIEEKKDELTDTKKAINDLSGKKIENSPQYQKVIKQNKILKKELDQHTKRSLQLKEEAKNVQNVVEKSRQKEAIKGQYTNSIKEKIEKLRFEIGKRKENEKKEDKIYQDIVSGIARSECRSAEMSIETRNLAIECEKELNKLEELKENNKFLQNENEAYLKKISRMSHETLEKLWFK